MITLVDGPLAGQQLETWHYVREGQHLVEKEPKPPFLDIVYACAPRPTRCIDWPRYVRYRREGDGWRYDPTYPACFRKAAS